MIKLQFFALLVLGSLLVAACGQQPVETPHRGVTTGPGHHYRPGASLLARGRLNAARSRVVGHKRREFGYGNDADRIS